MKKNDGRFKKGERRSPATEFQPGQHWRPRQPWWDKDWLEEEYVHKGRSLSEIATEHGVTSNAISFWLKRHGISGRSVSEARKLKHWGANGADNPMYGMKGKRHPSWKGGCTPERQAFYNSIEWAEVSRFVWQRDKGRCQRCGLERRRATLHIHHIVSFQVRELRADATNLVLLCLTCHKFVHSRENTIGEFIKKGG